MNTLIEELPEIFFMIDSEKLFIRKLILVSELDIESAIYFESL